MRLARLHQRIEHLRHAGHRHMQFPAKLADIVDAQQPHALDARDLDLLAGEPAEGGIGEIGSVHCARTSRARGTRQHQHAVVVGDVGDRHALAGALRQRSWSMS